MHLISFIVKPTSATEIQFGIIAPLKIAFLQTKKKLIRMHQK